MHSSDSKIEHSSTSDLSPMLKRVLSSRVLYAVSLPPPRRKNGIWKIQNWVGLGLIVSIFVLIWFTFRTSITLRDSLYSGGSKGNRVSAWDDPQVTDAIPSENRGADHRDTIYGVVFDAGSTGSRVHVFELRRPKDDPNKPFELAHELFEHVQPGLSAYADHPEQAAESLSVLLRMAERYIPSDRCRSTSVVLRATAGLRLLPPVKADNILSAVRRKLATSCLSMSNHSVSILDGNQEGLYLWISLNFMAGRMALPGSPDSQDPTALARTVGTLDLGGGSTQITFAPLDAQVLSRAPAGYITEIQTGEPVESVKARPGSDVYSHSYLGLGLMSARYSILQTATKRVPFELITTPNILFSPCFPESFTANWSHAGRDWIVKPLPRAQYQATLLRHEEAASAQTFGDSRVSAITKYCYAHALLVLRDPVEGDSAAHVFPPSGYVVHRPSGIENQEFYAFSYIFDLAISVGIIRDQTGGSVSVGQFRDAADRVCTSPNADKPFECMDLNFITALLHDGYGFSWDKKITLQKKIKTFEISWGLGALFAELSSSKVSRN